MRKERITDEFQTFSMSHWVDEKSFNEMETTMEKH